MELSKSLLRETFVSLWDSCSVGREKSKDRKSSELEVLSCLTRRHCCLRVNTFDMVNSREVKGKYPLDIPRGQAKPKQQTDCLERLCVWVKQVKRAVVVVLGCCYCFRSTGVSIVAKGRHSFRPSETPRPDTRHLKFEVVLLFQLASFEHIFCSQYPLYDMIFMDQIIDENRGVVE